METKFIAGSNGLEQIEAAIRYEEAAFQSATSSVIGNQSGQPGNKISFVPVSLPVGRLKLQFASAKIPTGHDKAWSATMIVAGATRQVTAWRAKAKAASQGTQKSATATTHAMALPELRPHAEPSRYSVKGVVLNGPAGTPVKQLSSPNHSAGNSRRYLVIHFTAGLTLEGTVSWFMNPAAKASAHFVVARDGSIVQMVPLDRKAWHAGESAWEGITGINAHSIGIEIVNGGMLRRTARGWATWAERIVPDDDVTVATHKNHTAQAGWHEYTDAQIDAVLELGVALHTAYDFKDVLGHDDISPNRKSDPGPLFPMASLRGRLFGRE